MRIAFFEVEPWEKEFISGSLSGHELEFFEEKLLPANARLALGCDAVSVFIYSKIDRLLLSRLPGLKFIATRSTGFDHIDLRECARRGVKVGNVPSYGENTVAEHTFALILSLSRNIHKAYERTVRGDFSIDGLTGFDLYGKTLGIVGFGRIGRHVARIARGFNLNVLVFDVKREPALAKRLGFKYASLDSLLTNSDIVTLHVPLNKQTHHLIGRKSISKMKRGAILINTARGGLVDTDALASALLSGKLRGAGLDVMEEEGIVKEEAQVLSKNFSKRTLQTLVKDHLLVTSANTIITPHIAFNSKEALERILETTIGNLKAFAAKRPKNLVS